MRAVKYIISALIFSCIAAAFAYSYAMSLYTGIGPLQEDKIILIPKGTGLNLIATKLENENVIQNRWIFKIAARLEGVEDSLKAGEYKIAKQESPESILQKISRGEVYVRQYTVPEGLTSSEIVDILKAQDNLSGDIAAIPPEGSLLPETYRYQYHDTRQDQIKHMQAAMQNTLNQLWDMRRRGLPFKSKEEALILASIVEKETGMDGERKKVAGVFINRMEVGMPLQSDPTVIYALTLGKEPLGRPLYRSDWKFESPYNTYINPGLPPGPITNPGREAIEAVLNPEEHDYYYFVADGTGGHAFARSLEEHNRNVRAWRKIRDAQ